jgi:RNA polymerase sigma factor (sigma-70 family)
MKSIAQSAAVLAARHPTGVGVVADRHVLEAKAVLLELEHAEGQALFGFALRLGLSEAEAQDAVQEALVRLWGQLHGGSRVENPRNWAFRTIYRVAMDEHRLRRRAMGLLDRIGRVTSVASTAEPTGDVDLWPEVDRLSARQRQVVYLRYQADLAFHEIGLVLGITPSAARSHCTFALAALRKRLRKAEVPQ